CARENGKLRYDWPRGDVFAQKKWIGLKTNADGDIILCLGSSACSAPSNIANATAGDIGLEGGALTVGAIPVVGKVIKPSVTKSTLKRIKRLVTNLSDNSRQGNGLSQEKVEQLQRIINKAGGTLRNDGARGLRGSSAGIPHVQVEGLGRKIKNRHIWTQPDIDI
ncbi:hypothetical protein, partial [Microbulbifer epialgicus]